jgi:hypothetical protein
LGTKSWYSQRHTDGEGARSYSAILILEDLMSHVSSAITSEYTKREAAYGHMTHKDYDTKPRDLFSYIFGACSGGLLAILLGRLQLTTDAAKAIFLQGLESAAGDGGRRGGGGGGGGGQLDRVVGAVVSTLPLAMREFRDANEARWTGKRGHVQTFRSDHDWCKV